MGVHPDQAPEVDGGFGDSQSLRTSPGEHPQQPIEPSHLGFEDLVELVSYHVRIDEHLATFREIKDKYITRDFPAWTILGVASLARPNLLIEVKAVAAAR
jgi:enamine deaminase RidA (YjgF/YER057c/UK114 family)